jgi:hypothetical protein
MRSTYRTSFQRQPKSVCCQGADVEIVIKAQFNGEQCALGNKPWQVKAMDRAS